MKLRILVTGIGGDLGQAIARALRRTTLFEAEIVGADSNTLHTWTASRFHDGWFHAIPRRDDPFWWPTLRAVAEARAVDVVVLASGAELAAGCGGLPDNVVRLRPEYLRRIFNDKWWTAQWMRESGLPFVRSRPIVAVDKPRNGSGGASVEFVRQRYLEGPEYTVGLYIERSGRTRVCGLRRELRGGATVRCWRESGGGSARVVHMASQLGGAASKAGGFGSLNVQGRLTAEGFVPFEINPRFSSTASMRAAFGFEDVAWSVLETLGEKLPPEPAEGYALGRAVRYWEEVVQVKGEWR